MWQEVQEKITMLRELDKQKQSFGAEFHLYEAKPKLTENQLLSIEDRLKFQLPRALRYFYLNVGNGGVGPAYGLLSVSALVDYRGAEPYRGVVAIRNQAHLAGEIFDDEYFEIPHEELSGLLPVIQEGCGHEYCLCTSGIDAGKIVWVSNDGFVSELDITLVDLYHKWLDEELLVFNSVKKMMADGLDFRKIEAQIQIQFKRHDAPDIMTSLLDIKKPEALFGTRHKKIYHGAIQDPWYEQQLKNMKDKVQ